MPKKAHEEWEEYKTRELECLLPILTRLGYTLDELQPHLGGERYLMRAVTTESGRKLILLGRAADGRRVVIKATSDAAGIEELEHERECRKVLGEINFAYGVFFSPEELLFIKEKGFAVSIQRFIEQEMSYLERPLPEQFALALKAFKAQESAHATTYKHLKLIARTFGSVDSAGYLRMFAGFGDFPEAQTFLEEHQETVQQYCGFLTHTDFVPHNFRIKDGDIYLLDHSSLRFGNKYEGWARFLNFMTLYNPELEQALVQYVRDNRTPEESLSLKLMRVYRLGEIIWYYQNTLEQSTGNLLLLNKARIEFWKKVLEATLAGTPVATQVREEYKKTRDTLRSEDEKRRQIGLH